MLALLDRAPLLNFLYLEEYKEVVLMGKESSHFDHKGNGDGGCSGKEPTFRTAVATGYISVVKNHGGGYGRSQNVKRQRCLGAARVAGIMGVKQTSSLIPMCIRCQSRSVQLI